MHALRNIAIYLVPFLLLGSALRLLLKRYAIDLPDVQFQAGSQRRARKVFLLGAWRSEK